MTQSAPTSYNLDYATAQEIIQQPATWHKTLLMVEQERSRIDAFLQPLLAQAGLRIILTGAGTSAFIGKILVPALTPKLNLRVEAIPTTDLVSNPLDYFSSGCPTLLVSFGRSGNSPESVAAVELANQTVKQCFHLIITCNESGRLHQRFAHSANTLSLLTPPETHDRGFAMTSSVSNMMLGCLAVFAPKQYNRESFLPIIENSQQIIAQYLQRPAPLFGQDDFNRVVYLGSGGLQGIAQESALKILELTAGKIGTLFDSPTGFRHGPKSIVDRNTLVVVFISNSTYTRKYDLDLLAELRNDNVARRVIAIADKNAGEISTGEHLYLPKTTNADDAHIGFCYLLYAQIYAYLTSLKSGASPDNPSPTGVVNRVVEGVVIHKLKI
ncbi:SIS domain-containing protein [Acerihabitans arboris]|uniref:SIS domain-containing protein n=1 Tax=Acerihabitans arboris TaxID=2691583 RepID=A0A845SCS0_9GAMM|nr:SIS domain-containing protein [Acerihabitans arboris]NDL61207.1 SIS domain-containing protein [Acerihabitans arboris]